ncbi:hypothetical protein D3C87_1196570 [compost metagenome]
MLAGSERAGYDFCMKSLYALILVFVVAGCASNRSKSPGPASAQAGFIETSTSPTIESLNREQTMARLEDVKAQIAEIDAQMGRAEERIKRFKKSRSADDSAMAAEAERVIPAYKEEKANLLTEKKALEAELSTVY